jgi:hypothetical protein
MLSSSTRLTGDVVKYGALFASTVIVNESVVIADVKSSMVS